MFKGAKRTPFVFIVILVALFLLLSKTQSILPAKSVSKESCSALQNVTDKRKCWENLFKLTFDENGIEAAFLLIDELNKTDRQFALDCHDFTHLLGRAAYELLAKGENIGFPPQTVLCGMGFYHGLTEILIQRKGAKEAGRLCDSKKAQFTSVLYDACYHGIGHGALSQTAQDRNIWGDMQKMLKFALVQCKNASDQRNSQARCANGAFMELLDKLGEGKLQVTLNNDYLSACIEKALIQKNIEVRSCYTQLVTGKNDLNDSEKLIEAIDGDVYSTAMMVTLAATTWDPSKTTQEEAVFICRSLDKYLRSPCIQGIALGRMLKGKPEAKLAIDFCSSPVLLEEERDLCFLLVVKQSQRMYEEDKITLICEQIDSRYKKNFCLDMGKSFLL